MADVSAQTFRTQFNGFNKDDVNGFIESMNVEFTENENNYKKIIVQQKKQLDDMSAKIDEIGAKTAELDRLTAEIAEAKEKNDALNAESEEKSEQADALRAEKEELANKLSAEENLRKKATDAIKSELNAAQKKLSEAAKSSAELLARAEAAEKKAAQAEKKLSESEQRSSMLAEAVSALQGELEDLKSAAGESDTEAAAELRETCDSLSADIEAYKAKETEYGDALASLDDQLKAMTAERDQFAVTATERDDEITALKVKLEALTAERDTVYTELQNELNKDASASCEAADEEKPAESADSDNEKARLYDKVSRQVGSMLIDAREIADGIISDANVKAERIVEKAESDAQTVRADADERRMRSLLYINQTMKRMSSACMSEYLRYINDARSALDKLLETNSTSEHAVFARFTSIMENAQRDIDTGLDKITKNKSDE